MKKRLSLAVAGLVAVLLAWSLRPLKSHEWDIEFDPELQAGKTAYLSALAGGTSGSSRPNIVIIVADDLGRTDISAYGSPHVNTPNIDSIGSEGLTFGSAYATAPICSPSRAGMLTGRYQNRFGFDSQPMTRYARTPLEYGIVDLFVDTAPMYPIRNESIPYPDQIERQGMPPSEIILPEALSAAGYRSDMVGKWHLGYGDLQYPTTRGFDSFFGFLEAFSYFIDPDEPGVESWQFDTFSEKHIWRQERRGYCAIRRNDAIVSETEHLTDAFSREAVERIHAAANDDRPFFLYLPFSAPHTPFQALERYTARFADETDPKKRIYYALIAQLDDAVGDVLNALEETGMSGNTLVIFTSDNGGATYTGATGNDPLRGGKMSHFEGGLSVPLLIRWPEALSPKGSFDEPVMLMDVFPTVLSAAGIPYPEDRPLDGIDLLSSGAEGTAGERPLFWKSDYNRIVVSGGWKLILNGKDGRNRLFDLKSDPGEEVDLIDLRRDVADELKRMIAEWEKGMSAPAWPRVMDYFYDEDGEGYWFAT